MSTWALVPVKSLDRAKQRLTPVLDGPDRRRLVEVMCHEVLGVLSEVRGLSGIALVTSEGQLVPPGLRRIEDRGDGLNAALARAAAVLESEGAATVLVIAADVPLMKSAEVEAVLAAGRDSPVVIVPDRWRRGTNALLLSPPTLIAPAFGDGSFARHAEMARSRGIEPVILGLPGLGFDVDDRADVDALRCATADRPAYRFLSPALEAAE